MASKLAFKKHVIDEGMNETCAVVDVDGDGVLDIVGGTHWYKGPDWKKYPMREIPFENNYVDNFADYVLDVNTDGKPDIISGSWFRKQIAWYENPGEAGKIWTEHVIDVPGNVETLCMVDLDGDGIPDILPNVMGVDNISWYKSIPGKNPEFKRVIIGHEGVGHGLGYGDINGDSRIDIITPNGWYEGPKDPVNDEWKWHPEFNLESTGVPVLTYDITGNGLMDIIWGAGHNYGLYWEEQKIDSAGNRTWVRHEIDSDWSQSHALALADLDKDGVMELITGKRLFAHNGNDPGGKDPSCLYWYKLNHDDFTWKRNVIDEGTKVGAGMQICVADVFNRGKLDIVAPGKGGLYLFENIG
ncbi:VCBS repeat-containing protein [Candidatus Poribacteria bacterium]|nr:VCBS repeat-containing protein [Candidatus Poribacteria bacterium]